jgi:hypothetical protein
MVLTLEIPDEIAAQLRTEDLSRAALEGLALEGYRRAVLSQVQVGRLLALSRTQTEDFLAEHLALYDDESGELQREDDALASLVNNSR